MSVVVSLLRAIDRADGEALVMHVGEKPYVVTPNGPAELAAKALTVPAMTGMLDQLLPPDSRKALDELGAVEYHLPPDASAPGMLYSVVAARGGDDIWIEVRRRKEAPEPPPVAVEQTVAAAVEYSSAVAVAEPPPVTAEEPARAVAFEEPEPLAVADPEPLPVAEPEPASYEVAEPQVLDVEPPVLETFEPRASETFEVLATPAAEISESPEDVSDAFELTVQTEDDFHEPDAIDDEDGDGEAALDAMSIPAFDFNVEPEPEPAAAVVVPMARVNLRLETPARPVNVDPLLHLLQVGAAQGASALYVAANARPSLRVDGEIRVLGEAPLTDAELETGLAAVVPERARGASFPLGETETFDVPEVGRVQCVGFRDHRGAGVTFRMLPARAISAEQSGLSAPIQALCTEPEGLLLVAGAGAAGKSTLVAALVDQINRTRRDHVITVENQIQFVHENQTSFVSQRQARDEAQFAEAVRTATREAPDVLVIDEVTSPEVARVVLQAAASRMVIAAVTATSTSGALGRFVEFFGDERAEAREAVAENLRGVITQVLLRKTGGGRAAAREVLVNVPSVSSLIAGAHFDQLVSVLNGGRRVGMVPLNDALLGLVQTGALDVRQAYRKSPDQPELVTMLKRAGLDTTFTETLA